MSTTTLRRERATETATQRPEPIDPRIAARRHEVARDRERRRRRRVVVASVITVLLTAAWFALHSPLLDVDSITVDGNSNTTTDQVMEASGLAVGEPLIDVRAARVREHLLALPWVADASVAVSWRGSVDVSLTERTALAVVRGPDGADVLVDGEGRALGPASGQTELIRIEGVAAGEPGTTLDSPAPDALEVIAALTPGVRSRVGGVVANGDGTVELSLRPQGTVVLGTVADIEAKLRSLTTVLGQVDLTDLATIDLRVPDLPTLTRTAGSTTSVVGVGGRTNG